MNRGHPLAFLASAIAGRLVAVQSLEHNLAQNVAQGDELAYSDGRIIFVPTAVEAQAQGWRAIAAQAALIGAGSLDASILLQLVGRRAAAERYLHWEMLRASRLLSIRLPWPFTALAELQAMPRSASAPESLELAASRVPVPQAPAYFGAIRPLLALRRALGEQGLSALARKQVEAPIASAPVPQLDDEDAGEVSVLLRLLQNPLSGRNPVADLLNTILGAGLSKHRRAGESGGDGGAEMPVGRIERSWRRGIHAVLSKMPLAAAALDAPVAAPTLTYPEWDTHSQTYRRNWVSVEEVEPWRADGATPARDALRLAPPTPELRRQLGGLGLDQEFHRRQTDGSDLDLGALIECAIDLSAGHSPSSVRVYRDALRTRRDLAVAIVLDISGSTGEQGNGGRTPFKDQVELAHQLGMALDSLGDTVVMFGFHSWGRQLVHVVKVKAYDERWSASVSERLRLLEPAGYTRIGTAIRHGSRVLIEQVRLPNRLLLLITDGIAYDQDYELAYGAADARKALEEARAAGTACLALSVGAATETETLSRVFGSTSMLAVDEVRQVTGRIRAVCRHALASVSRRRFG
jgi:hypothetical protein